MKNPLMALVAMFMLAPSTVTSKREMLAIARNQYLADVDADQNPVTKIAVGFILIAVALVVALAVFPVVADATAAAQASTNVTGASDTLLGLLPLLLVVGLLVGALAFLISGFKDLRESH